MKHGWIIAAAAVAGVALGGWAMTHFAPAPDRAVVGSHPPEMMLRALPSGDSVRLRATYQGHVTLINIWATWCEPCRREMPSIERLYVAYKDRGFKVAAVSVDEGDDAAVVAFGHDLGLTFDLLHDQSGHIQELYQTLGVPQTFIVGRDGRVAYLSMGASEWDSPEMKQRIELLLAAGN